MRKNLIILSISVLLTVFVSRMVFAAWDNTAYDPGETLNPECLPSDANCDVASPLTSGGIKTINSQSLVGTGNISINSMSMGGAIENAVAGSVLFTNTGGTLDQDDTNFLWDDTNHQLQIGPVSGFDGNSQIELSLSNDLDSYTGVYVQNVNAGASASTDILLGADNDGVDLTGHFADFGVLGSGWLAGSNPSFNGMAPNDIYLYGSGGNLILGTDGGVAGKVIKFFVGGLTTTDQKATLTTTGLGIGTTSPGSALDVKGTLRLSGSSSGYVAFAPKAAAGSTTYILPNADGSNNYVLTTDGNGNLSWSDKTGGVPGSVSSINGDSSSAQTITTNGGLTIENSGATHTLSVDFTYAPTWTGTHTFSNAVHSALFTGGSIGMGTITPSGYLSVTPPQYSTGTASQTLTTITGNGTTFTSAMIGSQFVFANGTSAGTISAVTDGTHLTVSTSQSVAEQAFQIAYTGLQVTTAGKVGIGTTNPGQQLELTKSLKLANTTDSTTGVIYKGSTPFFHDFSPTGASGKNIFIGENAGNFTMTFGSGDESSYNVGIGEGALSGNTTGYANTAIATGALRSNTTGYNNFALGWDSLGSNTEGYRNVGIGVNALYEATTGNSNIAIGYDAFLHGNPSESVAIGSLSGMGIASSTASRNTLIGYSTGYSLRTGGNNNIMIGWNAGDALRTGGGNIVIGYDIDLPLVTTSNTLDIGNLIYATGLGATGTTLSTGNVGIGVIDPSVKLQIEDANKTTANGGANVQIFSNSNYGIDLGGSLGLGGKYGATNRINFAHIAGRKENATSGNPAGYLTLSTTSASGNQSEWMRITSTGNVGIGNTNPGARLDITDSASTGAAIRLREGTTNGTNYVGIKAPDLLGGDYTYTLPSDFGTNGYVLTTNGAGALTWSSPGGSGMTDPMTTAGDLIYRNTSNATVRLAVGTAGQILTVTDVGGTLVPQWAAAPAGLTIGGDDSPVGQIQYRSGGNFAANDYFYLDPTNYELYVTGSKTGEKRAYFGNSHNGSGSSSGINIGNDIAADQFYLKINSSQFTSAANYAYVWNKANAPLIFGTNNASAMTILGNGNVGIGTTSPNELLHISTATSYAGATIGAAFIGNWSSTSYAIFAQNSIKNTESSYALLQGTSGNTFLNSATGQKISFRIGNADKMVIDSNGSIGIGTTTPGQKLAVLGAAGDTSVVSIATTSGNTCTFSTTTGVFSCASDERLKNSIASIAGEEALSKLSALNPVLFRYNWQDEEDPLIAGFIAQEFENTFPELVTTDPETGYKSLSYAPLMPFAIKAIQELDLKLTDVSDIKPDSPFTTRLIAWLGDTANGVQDFFANRVRTKTLCIGDDSGAETCITKAELDALLSNAGSSGSQVIIVQPEAPSGTNEEPQAEEPATEVPTVEEPAAEEPVIEEQPQQVQEEAPAEVPASDPVVEESAPVVE